MMRNFLLFSLLFFCQMLALAQRPFITGLDKTSAFYGETVTISGQNFTGSLQVNFGAGRATITSQSANQLLVTVPSTATNDFVIVTDVTTGLSGSSAEKFSLNYGGASLEASDFNTDFEIGTNGQFSWGLCSCDLDMDGDLDVVTTSRETNQFRIFLNTSAPTVTSFLESAITIITTSHPMRNVSCGDLNGDGKPEILIGTNIGTSVNHIFIIRNTNVTPGVSTFDQTAFNNAYLFRIPDLQSGDVRTPQQIGLSDLDGDGKNELIIGNATDNVLFIYQNTSTLSTVSVAPTPTAYTIPNSAGAGAFDFGDVNGDDRPDIVLIPGESAGTISLLVNNSLPGSLDFDVVTNLSSSQAWVSVSLVDLDRNGTLDIVASNTNSSNNLSTFSNSSTSSSVVFGSANTRSVSFPYILSSGDLNGDGFPDLALSSLTGRIYIFVNDGSVTLPAPIDLIIPQTDVTNGETVRFLQIADYNLDSKPDIAYISRSRGTPDATIGQFAIAINRNCYTPTISPADQTFCLLSPFTVETIRGLGLTYNWSVENGDATISSPTTRSTSITVNSGSSATIRSSVTSSDGLCVSTEDQLFSITGGTVPPAPTISNSSTGVICYGEDFTLSTSSTPDTWEWTQPDGTVSTSSTLIITSATADDAGTYTLRVRSVEGCTSEAGTITVQVDEPPTITITNNGEDNFCSTNSTELEVAAHTGFDYKWYRDNAEITSQTSTTLTVTTSGAYKAEIISSVNNCALQSLDYTVAAIPPPVSDFNANSEVCVDFPIDFTDASTGETGFTMDYSWDFGDETTGTGQTVNHTYTASGTYTAELTVSYQDVLLCSDAITMDVVVSDIPTIDITTPGGSFEKCPSDSLLLELPSGYQSYSWSTGDTGDSTYARTERFENSVSITVMARTDIGCDITASVTVDNFANSGFTVDSDFGLFTRDTLRLEEAISAIQLTATGGSDFEWSPSTLVEVSTGASTTVYPNTEYNVITLTGTDVNSCVETITLVIVNPGLLPRKTFSPNGDGLGYECWEIANSDQVEGCELYILDTRSRIIHQATSPFLANCAWDGSVDGGSGTAPEGIYYFILKCDNQDLNLTGSILLAR